MTDELSAPLSPQRKRKTAGSDRETRPQILRIAAWSSAAAFVLALAAGGVFLLRGDPLGGEPVVVLDLQSPAAQGGTASMQGGMEFRSGQPADGSSGTDVAIVTRLDGSGVDLSVPGASPSDQSLNPNAMRGGGQSGDMAALAADSADERVVEHANIGLLPRIGNNGEKPSDVYARQAQLSPVIGSGDPARIALMIGGLGISASITDEAIARLPEAVTLAFAPYGRDLQLRVDQARRSGHEVMLQIPMEPFDYPDNDPGPHTLLADGSNSDNLERLYWLMARFSGYFGVTNYMGAKFTSSADAVLPIQKELARRGLALLDDGSSQRSQLAAVAAGQGLPAGRADLVIDNGQSRKQIAEALAQLEALARERGFAIGSGSALPATIEAIDEWSKELAARGIILVPVSAALKSGQQS